MPAPLNPHLYPVVLHDANANPAGTASNPIVVSSAGTTPGTVITSAADVAVGVGATAPGPAIPSGTRRMTVQVTGGSDATRIRVREAGGAAGRGKLLNLLGSTMYGEDGGAIAPLEFENVAGPAATVAVQFERN